MRTTKVCVQVVVKRVYKLVYAMLAYRDIRVGYIATSPAGK